MTRGRGENQASSRTSKEVTHHNQNPVSNQLKHGHGYLSVKVRREPVHFSGN